MGSVTTSGYGAVTTSGYGTVTTSGYGTITTSGYGTVTTSGYQTVTTSTTTRTTSQELPLVFQKDDEFNVDRNYMITDLEVLGKQYNISFELFLTKFGTGLQAIMGMDYEFVFWLDLESDSRQLIITHYNRGINTAFNASLEIGQWISLEISQMLIDKKVQIKSIFFIILLKYL